MTICSNCGANNPEQARFCQTCGREIVLQTGAAENAIGRYAGFWQRFAAVFIDAIIVSFGGAVLFGTAHLVGGLASLFLPWIYEAAMLSSTRQATVGKMVLGIVVTDLEGHGISFARATGRHFAKYLSGLILGIGFFMAPFTQRRQALHDLIADTLVIEGRRPN